MGFQQAEKNRREVTVGGRRQPKRTEEGERFGATTLPKYPSSQNHEEKALGGKPMTRTGRPFPRERVSEKSSKWKSFCAETDAPGGVGNVGMLSQRDGEFGKTGLGTRRSRKQLRDDFQYGASGGFRDNIKGKGLEIKERTRRTRACNLRGTKKWQFMGESPGESIKGGGSIGGEP